ncbi:hypothetical protein BCT46_15215 [Vibrio sp. 10N.261.46.E8]|nr:hypothetical protein BH584_05035 [Vibrio sp. 10N.261.45.E1]PMJ34506.1 hypothetical protein BCU27_03500 [Vibrio sp. 10N.286.45.B6]PML88034.1 hypothetical protein BCT66_10570 [Vibrio sp. 10N.261.49.E11]PMM67361.1 hypothetical protein BCT48_15040 [Vibrio sp. 10N.261.46.F12]PMM81755.1 hypothetical protein BCT46_15215 [Vibrio sp. 10N.261.46.E8]PMN77877.1 hypothetical protein BCT22_20110 [Vibrio sp. 10N.261.45.A1]PMN91983.1 hypothetical protein BCT25_01165 [Vibrio sp. 10N.261.45.A6]
MSISDIKKAYYLVCWYTLGYKNKRPFTLEKLYGYFWHWLWFSFFIQSIYVFGGYINDTSFAPTKGLLDRVAVAVLFALMSWLYSSFVEKRNERI